MDASGHSTRRTGRGAAFAVTRTTPFTRQIRLIASGRGAHPSPRPGVGVPQFNGTLPSHTSARRHRRRFQTAPSTSAGHVPLLCVREVRSSEVNELPGRPVLEVLSGTDYLEETFTLEEGTALVMVTDSVVEGPGLTLGADLERAGTLAAQALHDGLIVEAIADGGRPPRRSATDAPEGRHRADRVRPPAPRCPSSPRTH
ncbi:SpoIIE family protein phosphatase [Streptomyces olivochromogenes]|uniref:SpoIIE family protein phosphatase n=1 Tax=Streptomyces olivochromogenes TaxID=1963 RepID=UPI0036BBB04E